MVDSIREEFAVWRKIIPPRSWWRTTGVVCAIAACGVSIIGCGFMIAALGERQLGSVTAIVGLMVTVAATQIRT